MMRVFGDTGGLARASDIVGRLRDKGVGQPISRVAHWITDRMVISVEWQSLLLVPAFQFNPSSMAVLDPVARVNGELRDLLDAWELAAWFANENAWLHGRSPAACILTEPDAVVDAAREDLYVMRG